MALTTPSRTMATTALALSAAVGVGADGTMVFSRPCPMSRLSSYQAEVHQTCDLDVANLCARPQVQDPFEALFGGGRGLHVGGGGDPFSSPFFTGRSVFDSDPFFRMVMTPPGIRSSPSLLDEFFGETVGPPFQREERRDEMESITSILDGMLDSAMKFALEPPPGVTVRVVRYGPDGVEEEIHEQQPAPVEENAAEDASAAADPADVAEAALERIVNSFLGHTVSASASTASASAASGDGNEEMADEDGQDDETIAKEDAEAEEEEEDDADEHPQAPRAVDGDVQREVLSHDDTDDALEDEPVRFDNTDDEDVEALLGEDRQDEEDPIEASYGAFGLDPVALARQMSEYGKKILQASDATAEEDDPELRRRRRLSEDPQPEIRRRLARRLQEVNPLVGMPTRIQLVPLGVVGGGEGGGSPLRIFLRQPEESQPEPTRRTVEERDVRPRLMLGPDVDACLWDNFEAGKVSQPCGQSLARTRQAFVALQDQDERREREAAAMVAAAAMQNFVRSEGGGEQESLGSAILEALVNSRFLLVAIWCFFFLLAIQACLNEDDDDDDDGYYHDDEERNPEDYVAFSDSGDFDGDIHLIDGKVYAKEGRVDHIHASPPCQGFSRANRNGGSVVYVGVPVQVV